MLAVNHLVGFGAAGAVAGPPPAFRSSGLPSGFSLSGSNRILTVSSAGASVRYACIDAVIPASAKVYMEMTLTALAAQQYGIGCGNTANQGAEGKDWGYRSWMWRQDGNTRGGSSGERSTVAQTIGNVIQVAFDAATGGIWFGQNNSWYTYTPPGAGPVETSTEVLAGAAIQVAVYATATATLTLHAVPTYSVPSGFTYLAGP
jgi:hypothetical protein